MTSVNKLFRRSEEAASSFEGPTEAPWGYPRIREKWLDSQFVLNRIYIRNDPLHFLDLLPSVSPLKPPKRLRKWSQKLLGNSAFSFVWPCEIVLEAKNYSKTARFSVSLKPPKRLRKKDPRVLVASQRPGAKNYSGTARFPLSGLAKSCLGPKITPKQRVSLCVWHL